MNVADAMASERIQRRINTLLDEAEQAKAHSKWDIMRWHLGTRDYHLMEVG